MFLFTDASSDPVAGAGLGAVLVSGEGHVLSWFEMWVDVQDLSTFLTDGKPDSYWKMGDSCCLHGAHDLVPIAEIGATHGLH